MIIIIMIVRVATATHPPTAPLIMTGRLLPVREKTSLSVDVSMFTQCGIITEGCHRQSSEIRWESTAVTAGKLYNMCPT